MSTKKSVSLSLFLIFLFLLCAGIFTHGVNSYADDGIGENEAVYEESENSDDIEPHGLFATLEFKIEGGNGKVWITGKNSFTLFPSTVYVTLYLYSSYTYTENYGDMTLVSSNTVTDLDMGKSIIAEASTGGEEKYWIGRMRYKVDGKDWKEKITGPAKYSADGDFIGVL